MIWLAQLPPKPIAPPPPAANRAPLDKSAYFAFVDREYIFTIEMVKPGVPLFNFISMTDAEQLLPAKEVRLTLDGRKAPGKFFLVDTGNPKEPVIIPSVRLRPKSSFGVRLQGEFGDTRELLGVTVRCGPDDFPLVPLSSFGLREPGPQGQPSQPRIPGPAGRLAGPQTRGDGDQGAGRPAPLNCVFPATGRSGLSAWTEFAVLKYSGVRRLGAAFRSSCGRNARRLGATPECEVAALRLTA